MRVENGEGVYDYWELGSLGNGLRALSIASGARVQASRWVSWGLIWVAL